MNSNQHSFLVTLPSNENEEGLPGKYTTRLSVPVDFGDERWSCGLYSICYPRSWHTLNSSVVYIHYKNRKIARVRLPGGNYEHISDILEYMNRGIRTLAIRVDNDIKRKASQTILNALAPTPPPTPPLPIDPYAPPAQVPPLTPPFEVELVGESRIPRDTLANPIELMEDTPESMIDRIAREDMETGRKWALRRIVQDLNVEKYTQLSHAQYNTGIGALKGFSQEEIAAIQRSMGEKDLGRLTSYLLGLVEKPDDWAFDVDRKLIHDPKYEIYDPTLREDTKQNPENGTSILEADLSHIPHVGTCELFKWNPTVQRVEIMCAGWLRDFSFELESAGLAVSLGLYAGRQYPFNGTVGKSVNTKPSNHPSGLFLYTNVIEPTRVGSVNRRLMEIVPVLGRSDEVPKYSPIHINYIPVSERILTDISIEICNQWADRIEFSSGTTVVQLHFRRTVTLR